MKERLDNQDKKILYELDKNSRQPSSFIAKRVSLSKEAVAYRIRKLVDYKHVKYFYALINATNIGYRYFKIFVKFLSFERELQENVISHLKKENCCSNIRILEGIYDISFITINESNQELNMFWKRFTGSFGDRLLKKEFHSVISSYKMNLNKFFPGKSNRIKLYHGKIKHEKVTDLDIQILKTFATKARINLVELGEVLKRSPSTLLAHKKNLEKKEIIAGYSTFIDLMRYSNIFIEINMSLKNTRHVEKAIEFFDSTDECLYAYELIGHYDLSVELYLDSEARLKEIMEEFKQKYSNMYINYDICHIYRDINVNWSPLR